MNMGRGVLLELDTPSVFFTSERNVLSGCTSYRKRKIIEFKIIKDGKFLEHSDV
jgi:hypothetical protein